MQCFESSDRPNKLNSNKMASLPGAEELTSAVSDRRYSALSPADQSQPSSSVRWHVLDAVSSSPPSPPPPLGELGELSPEDVDRQIAYVQRQINELSVPRSSRTRSREVPVKKSVGSVTDANGGSVKRSLPTIKLGSYDGSTALETHLAKLENCSAYYGWNAKDRLCHLKASLEGQAGQVLWQLNAGATEEDVVKLLKNRFGNVNQMERFRAELHGRRRKRGESIQSVYNDIRRLLALSFLGQSGELCEIIGRDAFLTALADPMLRVRVLDQSPATLDEALAIVCRMDAYSTAADGESSQDEAGRRKVRSVNTSTPADRDQKRSRDEKRDEKRLKQLESDVAEQKRQIRQLKADNDFWKSRAEVIGTAPPSVGPPWTPPFVGWHQQAPQFVTTPSTESAPPWSQQVAFQSPPPPTPGWGNVQSPSQQQSSASPEAPSIPAVGHPRPSGRGRAHRLQGAVDRDTCRTCLQRGHWSSRCPNGAAASTSANVNGVSDSNSWSCTYMNTNVNGVKVVCLLDSGSEHNLIPRRLVPNAVFSSCEVDLFAANGTKISVLGSMRLKFTASGLSLFADVLVTDDIDEFILGYEWLRTNRCHWQFDQGILFIDGMSVKLTSKPSKNKVRRIYVRETVCVPADYRTNIPVRLPACSLHAPSCDWIAEAKEVKPGLLMARTLLSNDDTYAAVQIVNVSGKDQFLRAGMFLDNAEPGIELGPLTDEACTMDGQENELPVGNALTEVVGYDPKVERAESYRPSELAGEWADETSGQPCRDTTYVKTNEYEPPERGDGPGSSYTADSDTSTTPRSDANFAVDSDKPPVACRSIGMRNSDCADTGDISGGAKGILSPPKVATEFDHIKLVIDNLPNDLSKDERERAIQLIKHNADLFSKHEYDLSKTNLMTSRIVTNNHPPISEPLRRHARIHLDLIDETVDKLQKAGLVEACSSPWSFNLVIVSKPGSSTPRITVDYRKLNEITYKDRYPLPRISDCLDALSYSMFYSLLTLAVHSFSWDWQNVIEIKPRLSLEKASFAGLLCLKVPLIRHPFFQD